MIGILSEAPEDYLKMDIQDCGGQWFNRRNRDDADGILGMHKFMAFCSLPSRQDYSSFSNIQDVYAKLRGPTSRITALILHTPIDEDVLRVFQSALYHPNLHRVNYHTVHTSPIFRRSQHGIKEFAP